MAVAAAEEEEDLAAEVVEGEEAEEDLIVVETEAARVEPAPATPDLETGPVASQAVATPTSAGEMSATNAKSPRVMLMVARVEEVMAVVATVEEEEEETAEVEEALIDVAVETDVEEEDSEAEMIAVEEEALAGAVMTDTVETDEGEVATGGAEEEEDMEGTDVGAEVLEVAGEGEVTVEEGAAPCMEAEGVVVTDTGHINPSHLSINNHWVAPDIDTTNQHLIKQALQRSKRSVILHYCKLYNLW